MANVLVSLLCLVAFFLECVSGVRFYRSYRSYYRYTYSYYRYTYSYYRYSNSTSGSYGGSIAGAVVGGLIVLGVIITIIVVLCKMCTRRRTRGRLVTPAVFTATTSAVPGTVVVNSYPNVMAESTVSYNAAAPGVIYPPLPGVGPSPQGNNMPPTEEKYPMPPSYDAAVGADSRSNTASTVDTAPRIVDVGTQRSS